MKRLFAVVGIAAFIAACSDSNVTAPVSRAQPHGASRIASDPPPPPLNGLTGEGDLFTGGSDFSALAVSTNSVAQCGDSHDFSFSFSGSYFANNPGTNERARIQLGAPGTVTGFIDVHELANGHSDASGHISNGLFSFDIQTGDGTITPITGGEPPQIIGVAFNFTVSGIITDLTTGAKCQASGSLFSGSD